MALLVERGDPMASDHHHVGHGCQVGHTGLHWAMDPGFREAFPAMYGAWEALARRGLLRPGDLERTLTEGRMVFTVGIKHGLEDEVDLAAIVQGVREAAEVTSAESIAFHRIGTRCEGRMEWSAVAPALEAIAPANGPDIVVYMDEWDDLIDTLVLGQEIDAEVSQVVPFGVFLDLGWPFAGLIDQPGIADELDLRPGHPLKARITALNDGHKQVRCSAVT